MHANGSEFEGLKVEEGDWEGKGGDVVGGEVEVGEIMAGGVLEWG